MGGWYRSPAYLIWVIGGLVVIVGVTVALGLSNPTDQRVIFAILPMLAVYMGGIFRSAPAVGRVGLQTDVQGPGVMAGHRHGRAVRIELDARSFETRVAQRAPSFKISGKDGRLAAAGDAPAAVRDALAALEPAARWRGVKVEAGDDGIVVKRRGSVRASEERRWMDDLWLAERLADAVAVP